MEPCRLSNLIADGLDVAVTCHRCHHNATVSASTLAAQLGARMPVPEVAGHMRCSACGSRDCETRPDWRSGGVVAAHGPSRLP